MESKKILRAFFAHREAAAALICMLVILIPVIFAPVFAPNDIYAQDLANSFALPSRQYPMGTDQLGRCVLSRILYGGRATLGCALITVVLSLAIGLTLGVLSGYLGGLLDNIIMRICDIMYAFPSMVLTLAFIAVAGRGMDKLVIALLLTNWVSFARLSRTLTIGEKSHRYIHAARISGSGPVKIMLTHIFPSVLPPMTAVLTINFGHTVLSISSLSFLGLGVQPPDPEWGAMISLGREFIHSHPLTMLWPGVFILLFVVSLNMVGDYLQDSLQAVKS